MSRLFTGRFAPANLLIVRSSPLIPPRPVGVIHLLKRLRQFVGAVLLLEGDPCCLEPRLGLVDGLGVAERRAGNRDSDGSEPTRRHAVAGKPDAANQLAVFVDAIVVGTDPAAGEHL
ncbi:hypothetical protein ACVIIW_004917 [Bradyrhizobium sp. USDA 4449]